MSFLNFSLALGDAVLLYIVYGHLKVRRLYWRERRLEQQHQRRFGLRVKDGK